MQYSRMVWMIEAPLLRNAEISQYTLPSQRHCTGCLKMAVIVSDFYQKLRSISQLLWLATKSERYESNKIEAINTLAVPVFTYIVSIVDW